MGEHAGASGWSDFPGIELVSRQTQILDDVGDDAAGHVTGVPGESDETIGVKWVRIMAMAARSAEEDATQLTQPLVKLAAIPSGEPLAQGLGGEDKFVAKSRWDRAPGFQERLEMHLGRLLEAQDGFPAIASVCVAPREQRALGDKDPIFIAHDFNFRNGNDHT